MPIQTFAFDPASGFNDTTVYTNPTSGAEARQQLQSLHEQTKTKVNEVITQVNTNTTAISGKANASNPSISFAIGDGTNTVVLRKSGNSPNQMLSLVSNVGGTTISNNLIDKDGTKLWASLSEALLKSKVTLEGTTLTIDLT